MMGVILLRTWMSFKFTVCLQVLRTDKEEEYLLTESNIEVKYYRASNVDKETHANGFELNYRPLPLAANCQSILAGLVGNTVLVVYLVIEVTEYHFS